MADPTVEMLNGLAEELEAVSTDFLNLTMSASQALMLHGVLHLALRHPGISEGVALACEDLAAELADKLAVLGPHTRTVCALNADPDFPRAA
jgi:hypothetical protein